MKNNFKEIYGMPDPSCIYKFSWSSIRLYEMTTSSCHRVLSDKISIENINDFHNTPLKLSTRKDMLDGKWPGMGCEYCKKIEDVNGVSDRMAENSIEEISNYIPYELLKNNRTIKVSPTIVEVYFNNLCNMACLYCNSDASSSWENENRKFNLVSQENFDLHDRRKKEYPKLVKLFWQWLEKNISTIVDYNILGGEPFFQPEFEENIEFFEKNPCPNLTLSIFSNLKVSTEKMKSILDRIQILIDQKKIKYFRLYASLDCWGTQAEYVRFGLDLNHWENNFKALITDYPYMMIVVHATMCNLTIKTVPELFKKINFYNKIRFEQGLPLIKVSVSLADGMTYLRADIFPDKFFDKDFEEMIKIAPTDFLKKQLTGFLDTINSQPYRPDLIEQLKIQLDDVDRRRKLNWRPLFPWLDHFST